MATATAAPPLDARYVARNYLAGKWPAILRRAVWMMVFIDLFMIVTINFVRLRFTPALHVTFAQNTYRGPGGFWGMLAVSLLTGAFVGAFVVAMLAVGVGAGSVTVYGDRLRLSLLGWKRDDVMFRDIVGVERIAFSSWPRRGSFWRDLQSQWRYLTTAHWIQHGMSQFFNTQASLVLVKVAGRKWVRGYLLDVDDPQHLVDALDGAIADYIGANGPEHQTK